MSLRFAVVVLVTLLPGCSTFRSLSEIQKDVQKLYDEVAAAAVRDAARAERLAYAREGKYVACSTSKACEDALPSLDVPEGVSLKVETTKTDSSYLFLVGARHERGTPGKVYTLEGGIRFKEPAKGKKRKAAPQKTASKPHRAKPAAKATREPQALKPPSLDGR
jgi:outer membrane murein-binding lipoprotein Lpp